MDITEVRIFSTKSKDGRLKAYATMTFDDWFVVRNVKVIQGNNGLFVAMPSRKIMDPCTKCGFKNVRGSKYCNDCGAPLERPVVPDTDRKRQSEHMDIAHPIRQKCRIYIQEKILAAYNAELERKRNEGDFYRPAGDDDFNAAADKYDDPDHTSEPAAQPEEESKPEGVEDIEL